MAVAVELWGWDSTNEKWVKVLVNSEGKLVVDPSELFEEPPTDGETGKGATSNWIYDHWKDPSAHHARYTDAEAQAAAVSDVAYGASWDGVTDVAPSKNAVYDKIEALGGGAGEGHITIIGYNYDSIGQGTWPIALTANSILNGYIYNSSNGNGDNVLYQAYLEAGTYTLRLITMTNVNRGIVDIDIDADEVASFDCYSGSAVYNVFKTQTGIVVATSGLKTITFRVDGKNGSSSAYYASIVTLALWRTA